MPKIYFLFPIIIIGGMLFYTFYVNKKFRSVKENVNVDELYNDFIEENYSDYSGMKFVASSFTEELGDAAKSWAKLGAKTLALKAVGIRYSETHEGPTHALIAYDNDKIVIIPTYVDIMDGSISNDPEIDPIEFLDSDISGLKLSDNGVIVFKDSDGEKLVLKVTDKDFFQKDQTAARDGFMHRIQNLKARLG